MNGGIPVGAPSLMFGIPNLGKSFFCFQIACMCTRDKAHGGYGKKVLYLDTENFLTGDTFERFFSFFKKRWPDLPRDMIEVVNMENLYALGEYFGIVFEMKQEDQRTTAIAKFPTEMQKKLANTAVRTGKKSDAEIKETRKDKNWQVRSPIWQRVATGDYGLVILDSITVPIKTEIAATTQNLPARCSILTCLLGALYPIAKAAGTKPAVGVLVTNHISRNPMSPGYIYGVGDPWGGQNIVYYVKYLFAMYRALSDDMKKLGEEGHRLRRIQRYRMPGYDQAMSTVLLGKDEGYKDAILTGAVSAT
jgi:hypothetical protein